MSQNPTEKKLTGPVEGYKAFEKDKKGIYTDGMGNKKRTYWKKGDRKTLEGDLQLCSNGYHFFTSLCFAINYLEEENEIYKIIAHGEIIQDTFKACTNSIEIREKITKEEIKRIIKNNYNSGNYNSGYRNSGNYNSGNYNSGYCNSGNYNSGYRNSGYCNSGNYNSGYRNSGDYNSGNYNSGNGYINYFCTKTRLFLFDIEVEEIPPSLLNLNMSWFKLEEKGKEGYLKAWSKCPVKILEIFRNIPEFQKEENKNKFKEITGISL